MPALNQIASNLAALGPRRLAVLGGAGLAILVAIFFGMSAILSPAYVPLYSQITASAASQMTQSLEAAGIPVRLSREGDVISVPENQIARARMALADGGLPSEGLPGWELFDETAGLGMNSFMQRVNRLRALEGELSRSIQTISGVEAARVHLVLPEREAFARTAPTPTASVIVRARPNVVLDRREAQSIRALVASAVADLDPQNITVLSATGETILADTDGAGGEAMLPTLRSQIESRLEESVTNILTARVGPGNARVRVSVDLSTEREVRRETSYDPDQRVERSTEVRNEARSETDPPQGDVDAGNNIPEALQDPGAGGQGTRNSDISSEITNYEIGSVEREVLREPGDIERISVAVLVNGVTRREGGETITEERAPEELARLEALVKSAVGFDAGRGDQVEMDSLAFDGFAADLGTPMVQPVRAVLADNAMGILRALFGLAAIALVFFLGRTPLRMILDAALPSPEMAGAGAWGGGGGGDVLASGDADMDAWIAQNSGPAGQIASSGGMPAPAMPLDFSPAIGAGGGDHDLVEVASVEGGVGQNKLKAVISVVEQEPEDALRVIESWLAEK